MRGRKAAEVLAGARELFLLQGFSGTSVEDIAARAGVSKATVYSNFADKDALLVALVDQLTAEAEGIVAAAVGALRGPGGIEERFTRLAVAISGGVLRPEVVRLRRLAVAEAARVPAAGRAYWSHGPGRTLELLEAEFRRLDAEGALAVPDPGAAAAMFAYALVGPGQDRALLTGSAPGPDELRRYARSVARTLLAAFAPDRRPDRERNRGPADRRG